MTGKTLEGFLDEVREASEQVFPGAGFDYTVVRSIHLSVRISLSEETFVDLYFNEETQRTDYALIHAGARIYGMDNLGGWHCHPFRAVEQHVPCSEPSAQEVFTEIKGIMTQLREERNAG